MSPSTTSPFLRTLLWADGLGALAGAAALFPLSGVLAGPLGLPQWLLQIAAALLLAIGLGIVWLARRQSIPRAGVWVVIAVNAIWVVDSLLLLAYLEPTRLGQVFILAQAAVVAVIAELEYFALRRQPAAAMA